MGSAKGRFSVAKRDKKRNKKLVYSISDSFSFTIMKERQGGRENGERVTTKATCTVLWWILKHMKSSWTALRHHYDAFFVLCKYEPLVVHWSFFCYLVQRTREKTRIMVPHFFKIFTLAFLPFDQKRNLNFPPLICFLEIVDTWHSTWNYKTPFTRWPLDQ